MKLLKLTAALAALTFTLAACGGGSSSGTSTPTPATGGQPVTASGGSGTPVDVTLADFSITVAGGAKLKPGTYTFNVTNTGPSGHNLTIEGPGVDNQATPTFTSGTQSLTVTLKKGSYEFFCSVPGHKEAGMDLVVTVGNTNSGGAAGGGSTEDSSSGSTGNSTSGGGSTESGGGWG
jgi:plastocyanin